MHDHESKITARRTMRAITLRMSERSDGNPYPWTSLSNKEARSLALHLLFLVDIDDETYDRNHGYKLEHLPARHGK